METLRVSRKRKNIFAVFGSYILPIFSGIAVQLSPNDEEPIVPLTSGVLYVHTSWGRDDSGCILAPPTQSGNTNALK